MYERNTIMKAIYLDCFSGISGNMLLGAFLQAGVSLAFLASELRKLPWGREFEIVAEPVKKQGIAASYVRVLPVEEAHEHHDHHDDHEHGAHHHVHRTMADIRRMIDASSLSSAVKARSLSIFGVLAEAEGRVHGKPAEEVAFHEVGAVDSIVDIVGTAICLDYLGVEKVFASRVNTGSGFVHCAHGVMPVPAPAVAELLRAWPSYHARKRSSRRRRAQPSCAVRPTLPRACRIRSRLTALPTGPAPGIPRSPMSCASISAIMQSVKPRGPLRISCCSRRISTIWSRRSLDISMNASFQRAR